MTRVIVGIKECKDTVIKFSIALNCSGVQLNFIPSHICGKVEGCLNSHIYICWFEDANCLSKKYKGSKHLGVNWDVGQKNFIFNLKPIDLKILLKMRNL